MMCTGIDHRRLRFALLWLLLVCLICGPAALAEVKKADVLNQQLKSSALELDKAESELKTFDTSISQAQIKLRELKQSIRENRKSISSLDQQIQRARIASSKHQQNISDYLLASYRMGQQAPLKMLLNQNDIAQTGRMLTYYRYFFEAHRDEVAQIKEQLKIQETLQQQKNSQAEKLEQMLSQLEQDLGSLERQRATRQQFISTLKKQQQETWQSLNRLKEDGRRLGQLSQGIASTQRSTSQSNANGTGFAQYKGRLSWPLAGRILARYGTPRDGSAQLRWQGLLISTHFGDKVAAVADGQIVFADWMRGFGFLVIVHHSGGYMTLYGHNEALLKKAGDQVKSGETLALAGNSGRSGDPALYFEIRHRGEPVNPGSWMVAKK